MDINIESQSWSRELIGLATTHDPAKSYGEEIVALLDQVYDTVNARGIPNTGLNYTVYESGNYMFVGIEPTTPLNNVEPLVAKSVTLDRYAHWKHVGSYSHLPQVVSDLCSEIDARGEKRGGAAVELYGHWTEDESKLETDIFFGLK